MPRMRRPLSALASASLSLVLLAAAGCGPNRAAITGTLVLPPNVQLNDSDSVEILFHPAEAGAMPATAKVNNADRTFTVKTADGYNVPPGKYKVTVRIVPYSAASADPRKVAFDNAVNNVYGTEAATKLEYEVTGDAKQAITIDLAQGKITKS